MRATRTGAWSLTAAVILLALGGSASFVGAQARPAADSVAEGATKIVQSVQETVKGLGKTLTEGATEVEQRAKAAAQSPGPLATSWSKAPRASASPSRMA